MNVNMKYVKKRIPVEAAQWWRNGDHPDDYTREVRSVSGTIRTPEERRAVNAEGEVVRYFRHPYLSGAAIHRSLLETTRSDCTARMEDHGWIDLDGAGLMVCPGDWVITDDQGVRSVCEARIFAQTYEPAEDVPGAGKHRKPLPCVDHQPRQHRDGKPPWCRRCGLTHTGEVPVSRFGRNQKGTPT